MSLNANRTLPKGQHCTTGEIGLYNTLRELPSKFRTTGTVEIVEFELSRHAKGISLALGT